MTLFHIIQSGAKCDNAFTLTPQQWIKETDAIGIIMIVAISVCLTLITLVAGANLIEMLGLTKESVEIGKSFFSAVASCYIIYGLAMALRGYLEGRAIC